MVPCRARGMPVDHNFKTGYFVVPDNIEHGDELMCSYQACRQAGVKFRYCLYCKVPVAKRNFRNRHRHGLPGYDGVEELSDSEESVEEEVDRARSRGDAAGALTAGTTCQRVSDVGGGDDGQAVKKENLIFLPGTDSDQRPLKKKRRMKVPCRARGMPMAHNAKTAYFVVPQQVQHGDELTCSFPACHQAGAKFRYCAVCKVPVAKRNFRNRHKHGNFTLDVKKKDELDGAAEKGKDGAVCDESKPPALETKPSSEQPQVSASTGTVSVSSSQDPTRVREWVSLLETKPDPDDKEAMSRWLTVLMNATSGSAPAPAAPPGPGLDTKLAAVRDPQDVNFNVITDVQDVKPYSAEEEEPPSKKAKTEESELKL